MHTSRLFLVTLGALTLSAPEPAPRGTKPLRRTSGHLAER
jgi:hypothetical protein